MDDDFFNICFFYVKNVIFDEEKYRFDIIIVRI